MTILQWAEFYRSKGFSVIPILYRDKKPAIPSWKEYQHRLPTDEELASWFSPSEPRNLAVVTGKVSNIAGVDLDSEKAVEFAKANNFPLSPLSKTGKGYHIIYRYKDGVRNFQKRDDLPDIDLRGDGGYILVEPSIHPSGHQYQWVKGKGLDDLPFADLPEIILAKSPEDKTPVRKLYKGVPEGQRNDSLARLVGSWANDKLTLEECLENAYLWNSKNEPPLDDKEIERTVKSIYKTHHREMKDWTPEEPFRLLDSLLKWNDILSLDIKTEYLLEGLIPKGSITLLFGRGGIGKTSLALQISRVIAEGLAFGELQTVKTPVYFIDFENPLSILKERVEKIGQSDNIYVWHISNPTLPPRLDSKEWELYKQLPPGLLIVDTVRASHLSDENSSRDSAIINARLKELREKGFTILLLTHTPKGNENIYKGTTAWLDLSDHVLGLEEVKESDTIEFDTDNLYRFGVRIKTRYDPHHLFLKFNPDIKGFEIAKDPDIEKMKDIQEILIQSQKTPNQTEFRKMIRDDLDYSDREARRLIKKGEDIYWQKELKKEGKGHKAFCYVQMSAIYMSDKQTQQNKTPLDSDITIPENQTQSLDNSHLSICQDTPQQINTTTNGEIIDLEHEEIEIIE